MEAHKTHMLQAVFRRRFWQRTWMIATAREEEQPVQRKRRSGREGYEEYEKEEKNKKINIDFVMTDKTRHKEETH